MVLKHDTGMLNTSDAFHCTTLMASRTNLSCFQQLSRDLCNTLIFLQMNCSLTVPAFVITEIKRAIGEKREEQKFSISLMRKKMAQKMEHQFFICNYFCTEYMCLQCNLPTSSSFCILFLRITEIKLHV